METSVLYVDPVTKQRTMWHYDPGTGKAYITSATDVEGMMLRNQSEFNAWNDCRRMGDLVKIGSIPISLMMKLRKEGIINDHDPKQTRFMKWMRENYSQYSKWMSAPKRAIG